MSKRQISGQLNAGIYIQNAGIVLLNQYISLLFERLGVIDANKNFINSMQLDAALYLQFTAVGLTDVDDRGLVLNKILCGIPVSQTITHQLEISPEHIELIEQLLQAVIGHWPAIGSTIIDGFRGNWLIRNGLLIEHAEKWELIVEKQSYDLLISKSPFSFSIIKCPWMEKPLYVQWPY